MAMRIEFCGVPGAGKSSLCRAVRDRLRQAGVALDDRDSLVDAQLRRRDFGLIANTIGAVIPGWRRAFLSLPHGMRDWMRFAVRHPDYVALVHEWLRAFATDSRRAACVLEAVVTTAFEYELGRCATAPVVVDEGFAQRLFTLRGYDGRGDPPDAGRYAECMPRPAVLILLTTTPETCLTRVRQRTRLPLLLESATASDLPRRFDEGTRLLAALGDALERNGVAVLRVAGDAQPEPTAARVAEFIRKPIESGS
jgi:thymidylate kinase